MRELIVEELQEMCVEVLDKFHFDAFGNNNYVLNSGTVIKKGLELCEIYFEENKITMYFYVIFMDKEKIHASTIHWPAGDINGFKLKQSWEGPCSNISGEDMPLNIETTDIQIVLNFIKRWLKS